MTRNPIAVALLSLALTVPGPASAGLVTWELSGTIEQVGPYSLPGGFQQLYADDLIPELEDAGLVPGAIWRARLRFDSDVSPEPCDECLGTSVFAGATQSIDFLAGGFSASTPAGAAGRAFTQAPGGFTNSLAFEAPMIGGAAGLVADFAGVYLWSLYPDVFVSSPLPSEPPEFAAWMSPGVGMDGVTFAAGLTVQGLGQVRNSDVEILSGGPMYVPQSFTIDGRITSITSVPEPSLAALTLGMVAASAIRRRSRALP